MCDSNNERTAGARVIHDTQRVMCFKARGPYDIRETERGRDALKSQPVNEKAVFVVGSSAVVSVTKCFFHVCELLCVHGKESTKVLPCCELCDRGEMFSGAEPARGVQWGPCAPCGKLLQP